MSLSAKKIQALVDAAASNKDHYKQVTGLESYYCGAFFDAKDFISSLILANADSDAINLGSKDFTRNLSSLLMLVNDYQFLVNQLEHSLKAERIS